MPSALCRPNVRLSLLTIVLGLLCCTLIGCDQATNRNDNAQNSSANSEDTQADTQTGADSTSQQPETTSTDGSVAAETSAAADDASSPVTVTLASHDEFMQRIEAQKGNVVLVDYWATWCVPCMQQFPHTIELHEKYKPSGLYVMTMSCDKPESETQVLNFLRKQRATTENLLTSADINSTFEQHNVQGGIPYYKLYDRHGQLRYEFNGQPSPDEKTEPIDQLEIRIKELLDEPIR